METKKEQVTAIPGRGGASLELLSSTPEQHTLLLTYGANRQNQLDDMWLIFVNRNTFQATSCQKLQIKELDEFTTRASMGSVTHKGYVIFYGGQDNEKQMLFTDVYIFDPATLSFDQRDYSEGEFQPRERNSHTMVRDKKKAVAYIFGGANVDGPLKDLFKLNLETLEFSQIHLNEEEVKMPCIEMHTAHLLNENTLLVIGGRGMQPGQTLEEITFQRKIYSIDLTNGKVSEFGDLPSDLGAHTSALIDDKYLIVYGGTNGMRFFDAISRYSIKDKKWELMTVQPTHTKKSRFFQDGRIQSSCVECDDMVIFFGGVSPEKDYSDFLILPIDHLKNDKNFSEINEIM